MIGNPPWERIKLQEREFFSLPAPEIATATNAAKRRQLVAKLESDDPALYERYQQALAAADSLLTYCRTSDQYPLTGKGDINTYAVFAELAYRLVAPHGRVGLLVPSGIASDMTTKDFFAAVAESNRLIRLYDFENRLKTFFPDVDGRFKFCILNFGGEQAATSQADFVFFAHRVEELEDRKRHIALERRRHPAAESQHANLPDLPLAARRGNHQSHLPPRSRLDRREPRGTDRQPVGHPVQDGCSIKRTTPNCSAKPTRSRRTVSS